MSWKWTGCPEGVELLFRSVGLVDEDDDATTLGEHVAHCDLCATRIRRLREVVLSGRPSHPSPELLARWYEESSALHPAVLRTIEHHLGSCADCREDLETSPAVLFGSTCMASEPFRLERSFDLVCRVRAAADPGAFPPPARGEAVRVSLSGTGDRRHRIMLRLAPLANVNPKTLLLVELRNGRDQVLATGIESAAPLSDGAGFVIDSGSRPLAPGRYVLALHRRTAIGTWIRIVDSRFEIAD